MNFDTIRETFFDRYYDAVDAAAAFLENVFDVVEEAVTEKPAVTVADIETLDFTESWKRIFG